MRVHCGLVINPSVLPAGSRPADDGEDAHARAIR
jgi:hypothetical protein